MFDLTQTKDKAAFYVITAIISTSLIAYSSLKNTPTKLIWNASQSIPKGFYQITNEMPAKGDLVLARLPNWAAFLANQRGYLPKNTPVLKRVSALKGDVVCRVSDRIYINQMFTAIAMRADQKSRKMPRWLGCKRLQQGEVFLLAGHPYSFDGRYFGITKLSSIIGTVQSAWLIAE